MMAPYENDSFKHAQSLCRLLKIVGTESVPSDNVERKNRFTVRRRSKRRCYASYFEVPFLVGLLRVDQRQSDFRCHSCFEDALLISDLDLDGVDLMSPFVDGLHIPRSELADGSDVGNLSRKGPIGM